jgi:hypothetical protein
MRVTELALIEEPVQRQYDLVRIFAFGLPQMPELDQPIDFGFAQVQCRATQSFAAPSTMSSHPLGRFG